MIENMDYKCVCQTLAHAAAGRGGDRGLGERVGGGEQAWACNLQHGQNCDFFVTLSYHNQNAQQQYDLSQALHLVLTIHSLQHRFVQIKRRLPPLIALEPIRSMVQQHLQRHGTAFQQRQMQRLVAIGIAQFEG
jgi:hypothetical protein